MTSRLHGTPTKGKVGLSASDCKGSSVELGPVWATPGCVRTGRVQPHIRGSRGKRCLAFLHSRRNKSSHRERGSWSPTFVRTPSSSPPLLSWLSQLHPSWLAPQQQPWPWQRLPLASSSLLPSSFVLPSLFISFSKVPFSISIVREFHVSMKLKVVFSLTFKIDRSSK